MKQFEVRVKDEIGSLGKVTEALANRGINIISISSERIPDKNAMLKIVTNDEDKTRDVMNEERMIYKESEFLRVTLTDQPGELLKVTRLLGNEAINIQSLYILNKREGATDVALIVDKFDEAQIALRKL